MNGDKNTLMGRHRSVELLVYVLIVVAAIAFLALGGMDGFANGTHP